MTEGTSLRERQAHQVRATVLDAVIAELESKAVDDVSMADVARAAGISLRTLYRYFRDRPALLQAAGEHLYGSLGVPFDIAGPEDISRSLLEAGRRLSSRPELTRTLVRTTAGRAMRSAVRGQRVEAIRTALKPATGGLDAETARWATAVITHLCSAASWVIISDESGLDEADAQQAVAWAIDALISALPRAERASRRQPEPS
ncbi:MAG: TetR/AcrR family transcriptional regulator [Jatrophihabitans sp.]|uniref:TetR/AcrR family transcriptional regulator n=1 Tax=Jatrophihabitans sp. TaxID=1932789 RepID=UPI0039137500